MIPFPYTSHSQNSQRTTSTLSPDFEAWLQAELQTCHLQMDAERQQMEAERSKFQAAALALGGGLYVCPNIP
jgi:hypothetical protein